MFSNRLTRAGLALVLALQTVSCGLGIGEGAPKEESPRFSGSGYSCVGEISDTIDRYFDDELSEAQINTFIRCLQKSFINFAQLTRGRDVSTYTPEEIRAFLQNYFFKERKLSDDLMNEFMVIKEVLIGGDRSRIARPELYAIVEVLEDLRKEAIRLKPHLPMLNPKLAEAQGGTMSLGVRLGEASDALRMTIQVLADRLRKSRKTYEFGHLENFLVSFRSFTEWDQHYPKAKPVAVWMDLLKIFKEIAVSPEDGQGIRADEWTRLLQTMSQWYLAYLQYRVGVKDRVVNGEIVKTSITEGVGLQNFILLVKEIFALTSEAITRQQPTYTITYAQIARLVESLQRLDWVNPKIRPASLRKALEATFSRIFADVRTAGQFRFVEGLKQSTLDSMRVHFDHWADIQLRLDSQPRPHALTDARSAPPALQPNSILPRDIRTRLAEMQDADFGEFLRFKDLMSPLFSERLSDAGPKDLVTISVVPPAARIDAGVTNGFYNQTWMNGLRAIVTLLFRGFADEGAAGGWKTGMQSAELQALFKSMQDLCIDLGYCDPRNDNAGTRSFVEGNLFTFDSDGLREVKGLGGQLTFVEAMELAAFLYSGSQVGDAFYNELAATCPKGDKDNKDLPMVDRCCALARLPEVFGKVLSNMPGLQRYLKQLKSTDGADARAEYAEILLKAVYSPENSTPDWVESNELTSLAVVMHYVEAVMVRFDRNQDGHLTYEEMVEGQVPATTVFSGYIQRFVNEHYREKLRAQIARGEASPTDTPDEVSEENARRAFLYILAFKQIPDLDGGWFATKWQKWLIFWHNLGRMPIDLDRRGLADVFSLIVGKLLASKSDLDANEVVTPLATPPIKSSGPKAKTPVDELLAKAAVRPTRPVTEPITGAQCRGRK